MPSFMPPLCYNCKHLKAGPKFIGDSGKCAKFSFIPREIFYQAGNCPHFTDINTTKPTPKRKK